MAQKPKDLRDEFNTPYSPTEGNKIRVYTVMIKMRFDLSMVLIFVSSLYPITGIYFSFPRTERVRPTSRCKISLAALLLLLAVWSL